MSADSPKTNDLLQTTTFGTPETTNLTHTMPMATEISFKSEPYDNILHQSWIHKLWYGMICGLKSFTTFLIYLTFILMLIVILNALFGDLLYDTNEMISTCQNGLNSLSGSWADTVNEEIVLNSNHDNIELLKKMNYMVLYMLNNGTTIPVPATATTASIPGTLIDFSDPNTLQLILNIEQDFDVVLYNLNNNNRDVDDIDILRQLDYANLVVFKSFRQASDAFKKKTLDAIKLKNQATTSSFTNDMNSSYVQPVTLDVDYGMAASGITQSDIVDQQSYMSNPDNVAAFSSAMIQSEISSLNDVDSYSVKPYGLRQVNNYVSPFSGPGFGAQIVSEDINTDASKIKKVCFSL
jgi:hypothetical protein